MKGNMYEALTKCPLFSTVRGSGWRGLNAHSRVRRVWSWPSATTNGTDIGYSRFTRRELRVQKLWRFPLMLSFAQPYPRRGLFRYHGQVRSDGYSSRLQ